MYWQHTFNLEDVILTFTRVLTLALSLNPHAHSRPPPSLYRYVRGTRHMYDADRTGSKGGEYSELTNFERFLEPRLAGQRLDWEYSNPNYTMNWEFYINKVNRLCVVWCGVVWCVLCVV